MSTASTAPVDDMDRPITEEIAKNFGLEFNPDKPQSMRDIFNGQMAGSLKLLSSIQAGSQAQIAQARKKVIERITGSSGESNLSPENKQMVDQIVRILSLYPQFIKQITTTLATMVNWQLQNDKLTNIYSQLNPTGLLDLLGKQQELLRASVPYELWPENQGKTPDQIAEELAVRNGTQAKPASPVPPVTPVIDPSATKSAT